MKQQFKLNNQSPQEECSICLTRLTRPVKCKGPCHKLFCLKCAAHSKCSDDRCPNRCSKPFQVESANIPLFCPFKPQECIIAISNEKDLVTHYELCPCISAQEKQKIHNKLNYKCTKGHNLTFLPKSSLIILYGKYWTEAGRVECSQCHQTQLCRAICMICSLKDKQQIYCCDCRMPPITKTHCPLGHALKHRNKPGKYRYCDVCDVPAGLLNSKVHGFCSCEFDLCEFCYLKLPSVNDKIPLKCNPEKLWPLSMIKDDDSSDSDWQEKK